jgi:hypothetical protein
MGIYTSVNLGCMLQGLTDFFQKYNKTGSETGDINGQMNVPISLWVDKQ